jgi:ActR/RegA family two-component response regulator
MAAPSPLVVKTVVVADDTDFVRDRFRAAIEHAGHRAVTARNRTELLAVLLRNTPPIDLIVLDLRLANGKGLELLRAIRQQGVERPVIVFSGTIANALEVTELARLGVSGYLNEYTGAQHIVPALAPHLFPEGQNRRSSPRVTLGVSLTRSSRPTSSRTGRPSLASIARAISVPHGLSAPPLGLSRRLSALSRRQDMCAATHVTATGRRVNIRVPQGV